MTPFSHCPVYKVHLQVDIGVFACYSLACCVESACSIDGVSYMRDDASPVVWCIRDDISPICSDLVASIAANEYKVVYSGDM